MPYIKQENRPQFDDSARDIAAKADCAGDLNYAITVILQEYIKKKGLKYDVLNSVHGMMHCCNEELYRTITGPYEQACINKNGNVTILQDILAEACKQANATMGYKAPVDKY